MALRFKNPFSIGSPAVGKFLTTDGSGDLTWDTPAGGGGEVTVGTIDSEPKSLDGLVVADGELVAQSADIDYPGLVTPHEQDFAGVKHFLEQIDAPYMETYDLYSGPELGDPLSIYGGQEDGTDDAPVIIRNSFEAGTATAGDLLQVVNDEVVKAHIDYAGNIYAGNVYAPNLPRLLYQSAPVAVVGAGADIFPYSYTLPAGTLGIGAALRILAVWSSNGDSNSKPIKFYMAGSAIRDTNMFAAGLGYFWYELELWIMRYDTGLLIRQTGSSVLSAGWLAGNYGIATTGGTDHSLQSSALTNSSDIEFKMMVNQPNTYARYMRVELHPSG